MEQGGGAVTRSEFVFSFGGFYVCADFGGNWWWSASVRVRTHGHTYSAVLQCVPCCTLCVCVCVADKNLVSRRVCKFSLISLIRLFLHTVFGNTYSTDSVIATPGSPVTYSYSAHVIIFYLMSAYFRSAPAQLTCSGNSQFTLNKRNFNLSGSRWTQIGQ